MEISPHIGWANAVPDAIAIVDLSIGGTELSFVGSGYHDKVGNVSNEKHDEE